MKLTKKGLASIIFIGMIITSFLYLLLYFIISSSSDNCVFTLPNGKKIDLSSVSSNTDYYFSHWKYNIKANLCRRLNDPCKNSQYGAYSIASITSKNPGTNDCISLTSNSKGTYSNASFGAGLSLIYPPGDFCLGTEKRYQLKYNFFCDKNTEFKLFSATEVISCQFTFLFKTKYVCDGIFEEKSNSTSKYLLSGIVILFMIYLCFFTYKNFRSNPEDGWIKALPHREFWKEFITDFRLGVNLTYFKIRSITRGRFTKENIQQFFNKYRIKKLNFNDNSNYGRIEQTGKYYNSV